ncbi:hypothetical protein OH77DRAFT_1522041 [Trametes cingulata]|nr:hypothetical protein OH77DRAFT_1522041 [Trametes cingulata]
MQRDHATAAAPDAEPCLKQLTLWLDSAQPHLPPRKRMAKTTYQAPIAKLPVELLSYIFILGAHTPDANDTLTHDGEGSNDCNASGPDGRYDISPCVSSSSTPPDVFASVNRHWREVALGTPQLWTRICVTIGDLMHSGEGKWFPAVSRYLWRSGKCPLDVYIDARDPDWDFSESDSIGAVISPYIDETYDYTHPFKVEHMHYVLNLLVPHIVRMRSLAILTDRWAPMETALQCLSLKDPGFVSCPSPFPSSLPLLESLVLMRCNEFVSYHPQFSPADRRHPAHLPFSGLLAASGRSNVEKPLLPRLRQLVLSGVHVDWSSLPQLLPSSPTSDGVGVRRLELSYHCADVRPREEEFRDILQACQRLESLTVRVSGPQSPDSPVSCSPTISAPPIALPRLEAFELGYDDIYTATAILDSMDFAQVRHVVLEDASSPARDETLDAERLLLACAKTTSPTSANYGKPLFPRALSVILRRVDAPAEAFEAFYESLPCLRELTVAQMFLLGAKALTDRDVRLTFIPSGGPVSAPSYTPLPIEPAGPPAKVAAEGESFLGFSAHKIVARPGPRAFEGGLFAPW